MVKRWKIDGTKSAMWNLFDACRVATLAIRAKYVRKVKMTRDEWNELADIVILHAVNLFMESKIRGKTYCHNVSFLTNAWSCVWSCFYQEMNKYIKNVNARKALSIDHLKETKESIDAGEFTQIKARANFIEQLMATPMPRYCSDKGDRNIAQANLRTWLKRSTHSTFAKSEDEDDFWSYLESCEELGIPVNKESRLYIRGRDIVKEKVASKRRNRSTHQLTLKLVT